MTPILIGVTVFIVASLIAIVVTRSRTPVAPPAKLEEVFPPISDDEFIARCTPGTSPDVALKVRRIVAEHLAVSYENVHPSMRFIEDIGAD